MEKLFQYLDRKTLVDVFGYVDTNHNGVLDSEDTLTYTIPERAVKGDVVRDAQTRTASVTDLNLATTEAFEQFLYMLTLRRALFFEENSALSGTRVYLALSWINSVDGLEFLYRLDKHQKSGHDGKDVMLPLDAGSQRFAPELHSCADYICELYLDDIKDYWPSGNAWQLGSAIFDYDRCLEKYPAK